jgi:histidinol-phosphate/aromatic aminotransferase/cobyric acid decarboxylase-like protein
MYVLEWAEGSSYFHVQELQRALMSNLVRFQKNKPGRWIPLAVGTDEEMSALADQLRPLLIRREAAA